MSARSIRLIYTLVCSLHERDILYIFLIYDTDTAAPQYTMAFSYNIAMSALTIIFATILRVVLGRLNKKLDEEEGTDIAPSPRQQENEEHGLPGQAVAQGFRFLL